MIEARSGKDFDNIYGPVIVCLALIIALCLNFAMRVSVANGLMAEVANSC